MLRRSSLGAGTARGLGQPHQLGRKVQDADPSLGVAVAGWVSEKGYRVVEPDGAALLGW